MKVTIFGAGYVGLVTATCLADLGHQVLCIDTNAHKIEQLDQGLCPIYEPGLTELIKKNYQNNTLKFSTDIQAGVQFGEVIYIAVGTPTGQDGSADLQYVLSLAHSIGEYITDYRLIVTKSTVPVGTAMKIKKLIQQHLALREQTVIFDVASNPEFLREGQAIKDFMQPDRIIIGTDSQLALEKLTTLYHSLKDKLIAMDIPSAELTKYAANTFLAIKISFMNEMSLLAEQVGADITNIHLGIGSDKRIGYDFLQAGCGYGGSCFPKDVREFINIAHRADSTALLAQACEKINQQQKDVLMMKILHHFKYRLKDKTFALWGLAFKPNTDDLREATSGTVISQLLQAGAKIKAFDPVANSAAAKIYENEVNLQLCQTMYEALSDADGLIIVTEWKMFVEADLKRVKEMLNHPVIFDGRNIYPPNTVLKQGLSYYTIGRGTHLTEWISDEATTN